MVNPCPKAEKCQWPLCPLNCPGRLPRSYISDATKLTDHEQELAVITMEEAAEVIEQANLLIQSCVNVIYMSSKTIRFGKEDVSPKRPDLGDNVKRLAEECGHVQAVVRMLIEAGIIDPKIVLDASLAKIDKVNYYLQHPKEAADAQKDGGSERTVTPLGAERVDLTKRQG